MIESYIKQLSKIMKRYIDTLASIESRIFGAWGEVNLSKIATEESKAKVLSFD